MCSRLGKYTSSRAPFEINVIAGLAFIGIECSFFALKDGRDTVNMPTCITHDAFAQSHSKMQEASKETVCTLL